MSDLGSIKTTITADDGAFQVAIKNSGKAIEDFAAKAKKSSGIAVKSISAIGAAAATAAIGGMTALYLATGKTEDALGKLSDKLGEAPERLTALRHAAELSGVAAGSMDASLAKLNRTVGEAQAGFGQGKIYLEKFGLANKEFFDLSPADKFAKISDKVNGLASQSEKAAAATALFGRSGQDLINVMAIGSDGLADLEKHVEAVGLSLSRIEIAQIESANDAFFEAQQIVGTFGKKMTAELAPVVEAVMKLFSKTATEAGGFGDVATKAVNFVIKAIGFGLDAVEGFKRTFELAGKGIVVVLLTVQGAALHLADHIINGPTNALNGLIDLANKIPGVNIANAGLTGFGAAVKEQADLARDALQFAIDDMHEVLMQPMPSAFLDQFVIDAKAASLEAAEAAVSAKKAFGSDVDVDVEAVDPKENPEILKLIDLTKVRRELLYEQYESEGQMLTDALAAKQITVEQYNDAMLGSEMQYQSALQELQNKENQARMQSAQSALGSLSTLMNSHSRKAFEAGKAAAIANTAINTAQAAMGAYSSLSSIPIVGPVLGGLAAAAAVAAGVVQMQNIKKTKFGSGSAGAATSNTAAVNAAAEPVQGANAPTQTHYLQGLKKDELYDGAQLMEVMNRQIESGGRLVGMGA